MSAVDQEQVIEFVIDRNPSPITVTDSDSDTEQHIFISPPLRNVNTSRRCSFCECPGHTIRNCFHSDIQKLHRCAQFIFLTTIRYLRTYPNEVNYHTLWLDHLSTSEYKILSRLNMLPTNSRTSRVEFIDILRQFYTNYAMNELRNDRSINTVSTIRRMYIPILSQMTEHDFMQRYGESVLDNVIITSGRNLLDMHKIRQSFREMIHQHHSLREDFVRYYHYSSNPSFNLGGLAASYRIHTQPTVVAKILPKTVHNPSLANEPHDECPICYSLMTNETTVQLGCSHSFCGDCIIRQIKSSKNSTSDCAMCRSTINECSSACEKMLQKISTELK